jgi:hypothetical protein
MKIKISKIINVQHHSYKILIFFVMLSIDDANSFQNISNKLLFKIQEYES